MRPMKLGLGLFGAFRVGCATAGVASQLVVPPVRAGTNPTRWEVQCFDAEGLGVEQGWPNHDLRKPNGWNVKLKEIGAKGWGPVQFLQATHPANPGIMAVCFKRPLP